MPLVGLKARKVTMVTTVGSVHFDTLVFFGATGDPHKKIFPALCGW
jgi:hypothetical protein